MKIQDYAEALNDKVIERNLAIKALSKWEEDREIQIETLGNLESARSIIQKAAQITQSQLSVHISGIVSSALAAVFDDPYKFVADFVTRRNSTECDLLFEKNGKTMKPLDSCGYGAADIASLALRVAYWKLDGSARNLLALDEPTRNLSADKQPLASMMINKLSKSLYLQFLIVTHNQALTEGADKVFYVTKDKYSVVKEM